MIESLLPLCYFLLCSALLLVFVRLYLGPSLADRVVALELMATLILGMIGLYSLDAGRHHLLDIGLVIALTSFLAAVGFARYLDKRGVSDVD